MKLENRFPQKRVLITGANSGFGKAMAMHFGRKGWRVAVTGRRPDAVRAAAEDVRRAGAAEAVAMVIDVSKPDDFAAAAAQVEAQWGGLDILVNNAGIIDSARLQDITLGQWHRVMDINLRAVFLMCHEVLPHMVAAGSGSIVNIASISALRGQPSACSYSASKAGMINFARSIANDYGRHGIRANNILPGLVETELSRSRLKPGETWDGVVAAQFLQFYPLGRVGQPADIANAALFLASDEAAWITGIDLVVDGGYLARL